MKFSQFQDAKDIILHVTGIFSFLPQFSAAVAKVELTLSHSALLMNK